MMKLCSKSTPLELALPTLNTYKPRDPSELIHNTKTRLLGSVLLQDTGTASYP